MHFDNNKTGEWPPKAIPITPGLIQQLAPMAPDPLYTQVRPIGCLVNIGQGKACINEIQISPEGVRYNVSWWANAVRYTAWIYEHEIETLPTNTRVIGFRS
jgi:hypothetical protein